jgi:hypothetical protein
VALSGNKENKSMRLIKYFSKAQEDAWRRETELVKELSNGDGHSNILKYCWHSRGMEKCHLLLLLYKLKCRFELRLKFVELYECFPLA